MALGICESKCRTVKEDISPGELAAMRYGPDAHSAKWLARAIPEYSADVSAAPENRVGPHRDTGRRRDEVGGARIRLPHEPLAGKPMRKAEEAADVHRIQAGDEVAGAKDAVPGELEVEREAELPLRWALDLDADVVQPLPGGIRDHPGDRPSRPHGGVDAGRCVPSGSVYQSGGANVGLAAVKLRGVASRVAASAAKGQRVATGRQGDDRIGSVGLGRRRAVAV